MRFHVERCRSCGLAFAAPRPTAADLDAFYSGTYFNRPEGADVGYADYAGESWGRANAQRMWSLVTRWEPSLLTVEPHTLLDVGCALGDFALSVAASGWTVCGVELADEAREQAIHAGVPATRSIAEAPDGNGLITMFHVLEHVLHPVDTLREARSKVSATGRLLVELPQWRSLGRVLKRGSWSAFTPPEHINFFDTGSIRRALDVSGWRPVRVAAVHTQAADRAVEAVEQRRPVRALRYFTEMTVLERAGLAGYLRVVAAPA